MKAVFLRIKFIRVLPNVIAFKHAIITKASTASLVVSKFLQQIPPKLCPKSPDYQARRTCVSYPATRSTACQGQGSGFQATSEIKRAEKWFFKNFRQLSLVKKALRDQSPDIHLYISTGNSICFWLAGYSPKFERTGEDRGL